MVGKENAGAPVLLDTHRPDAFVLGPLNLQAAAPEVRDRPGALRLAFRVFRPAPRAQVKLTDRAPRTIYAPGVKGSVMRAAGPWRTSGEWWDAASCWNREEWDVALDDGSLYRIYLDLHTREWHVQGIYD
jgi:protein ImuB